MIASNTDSVTFVDIDGYANEPDQTVNRYNASSGYFQAMEIRLIAKRLQSGN